MSMTPPVKPMPTLPPVLLGLDKKGDEVTYQRQASGGLLSCVDADNYAVDVHLTPEMAGKLLSQLRGRYL